MDDGQLHNSISVKRHAVTMAGYNPRTITDDAKRKLKKSLKTYGLLQPFIVNQNTGHLISGHQRLAILDSIHKQKEDYDIPVVYIQVNEADERRINVLMNQQSLQGDFDYKAVYSMLDDIGIAHEAELQDLGFSSIDIDRISIEADVSFDNSDNHIDNDIREMQNTLHKTTQLTPEKQAVMQNVKREIRENAKADKALGISGSIEDKDFVLSLVFPNNIEKRLFATQLGLHEQEKVIVIDKFIAAFQALEKSIASETDTAQD